MDAELAPSLEKKREISNGEDPPPSKKPRLGPEDMGRVAEIVLVLSAMGRMRGGKDPTEAELALMAEAREKLALICETLAPKDIVASDAIERVIEDLGLKSRDQRLGFKVPKLSIAEKLLFTKRKMEEAKKYPTHAPTYTSHSSQGSFSSGTENRGAVQLRFQSDKLSQPAVPSGSIPTASGNSGSITYHFGAPNESRTSAIPSVLSSSHSGKESSTFVVPKVERTQAVNEVASAGSSKSLQANSLTNQPSMNVPAKSTSLANLGPEKNTTIQTPGKVQESTSFGTSLSSQPATVPRPYTTKTVSLNPPSNYGNHNEIVKMVQKWLPPKLPEYPTWTPPSREYMNKALTCQICQTTITDVESVLLCDACEKGYHLKCMHAQNQRGIPKVEWHCQKCLALSHGKPLPPKYGRVMRSMATSKMPVSTFGVNSSSEKKMGTLASNETSGLQNTGPVAAVDNNRLGLQIPESGETRENNPAPMNEDKHEKLCPLDSTANVTNTIGPSLPESSPSETKKADILMSDLPENDSEPPANGSENLLSLQNPSDDMKSQLPDCKAETSMSEAGQVSKLSSELPEKESEHFPSLQNPSGNIQVQPPDSKALSSINETKQASKVSSELPDSSISETRQHSSDNNQSPLPDCAGLSVEQNEKSCSVNKESENSSSKDHTNSSSASAKVDDAEIRMQDPIASTESTDTASGHDAPSPDVLHAVEWTSDVLEIVDGKEFYSSCCVNGVTYKLKEHALFHSSQGKLEPFLLMAMWVDKATGLKWVNVTRCYFPGDLPENVGHPFTEANEVFESNHEETFMAGLISGPCEVLPSIKYKEEIERRSHIGADAIAGLKPIFLCKWLYDEAKGHFQPISS